MSHRVADWKQHDHIIAAVDNIIYTQSTVGLLLIAGPYKNSGASGFRLSLKFSLNSQKHLAVFSLLSKFYWKKLFASSLYAAVSLL